MPLSDFIPELLSRDCVEQNTCQCLKVLNCTWWNLSWRNAAWFNVSSSRLAGAAENCTWSTEFWGLGANFYCLGAKMRYLNATHREYEDTQVCHCSMGDLSHHPLVPSYWLKRDSWHHLSAVGSPHWSRWPTQTAEDRYHAESVSRIVFNSALSKMFLIH